MKLRNLLLFCFLMTFSMIMSQESIVQSTEKDDLTFTQLVIGETNSPLMFFVFVCFGFAGLILSLCFDIYSSGTNIKTFSFKYWIKSNVWRILLSAMVIIVAILFSEQLVGMSMSNWSSFIAGFTADKIIENLMQRKRRIKQNNTKTEKDEQ